MVVTLDPETIHARRKQIANERARLEQQLGSLQQEDGELEATLRVIERYAANSHGGEVRDEPAEEDDSGEWTPRPSGIPTNFEMVEAILAAAEKEGRDGLAASELVAEIRSSYWPGLASKQVMPSIYQYAKNGRLKKSAAGKFRRVNRSL